METKLNETNGTLDPAGIPKARDLSYLPIPGVLKNGLEVYLERIYPKDPKHQQDVHEMYKILKDISDEGIHHPFARFTREDHEKYFLTHDVFLLKIKESNQQIGSFYIKPFYPERSAHICNPGFGVMKAYRGLGALQFMIKAYLRLARDLGYLISYFSMVYSTNKAALQVYRKMGFRQSGSIANAGILKGIGYVDGYQFTYDLTTLDADGCPVGGWKV